MDEIIRHFPHSINTFAKTATQTDFPGVNIYLTTLSWLLIMAVIEAGVTSTSIYVDEILQQFSARCRQG